MAYEIHCIVPETAKPCCPAGVRSVTAHALPFVPQNQPVLPLKECAGYYFAKQKD